VENVLLTKEKYIITINHDLAYNFSLKIATPNRGYEFHLLFASMNQTKD